MKALKQGFRVGEIAEPRVRAPLGHVQGRRLEAVVRLRLVVSPQSVLIATPNSAGASALWVAGRHHRARRGVPLLRSRLGRALLPLPHRRALRLHRRGPAARASPREAAKSAKFFMYPPLPMYVLNLSCDSTRRCRTRSILTVPRDEVTYMVLGRGDFGGVRHGDDSARLRDRQPARRPARRGDRRAAAGLQRSSTCATPISSPPTSA